MHYLQNSVFICEVVIKEVGVSEGNGEEALYFLTHAANYDTFNFYYKFG